MEYSAGIDCLLSDRWNKLHGSTKSKVLVNKCMQYQCMWMDTVSLKKKRQKMHCFLQGKILFRVKSKSYISPSVGYSNATLFETALLKEMLNCFTQVQPWWTMQRKVHKTVLLPRLFILLKLLEIERLFNNRLMTIENTSPQLLYKSRNYLNQISSHFFKKVPKLAAFLLN